jgi:anti-sigma regulatory factor (Ser/Thr protein kinase)
MSAAAWRALLARTVDVQGAASPTFHLDLSAQPTEVGHARTFLRSRLAGYPQLPLDLILLLTSELVTNAMLHADATPSTIGLDVCIHPGRFEKDGPCALIGVTDGSATAPKPRPRSRSKEGGRGLQIVRELADDWGWMPADETGGKIVWFRVQARAARPVRRRVGGEPGTSRSPESR